MMFNTSTKTQRGISISCRCFILSSTKTFYINFFKSKSLSSLIRFYDFVRLLIKNSKHCNTKYACKITGTLHTVLNCTCPRLQN